MPLIHQVKTTHEAVVLLIISMKARKKLQQNFFPLQPLSLEPSSGIEPEKPLPYQGSALPTEL